MARIDMLFFLEETFEILEYINDIISTNRSPVFTIVLEAGTYYIGYANNTDNIEINFALRRKVNTNLNIDGTLVTDPARDQGFPLGSEVIFKEGILLGNTITEGFTRNLYLMIEDRIKDINILFKETDYSTGELSLFNIARAIIIGSKILFLDEMNAKIDSLTAKKIINVIKNISKDKMILLINHYGSLLKNSKVINLEKNKVIK